MKRSPRRELYLNANTFTITDHDGTVVHRFYSWWEIKDWMYRNGLTMEPFKLEAVEQPH